MNRKQDDTEQMARGIGKTHIIVCKQQMLEGIREVMQKKISQKMSPTSYRAAPPRVRIVLPPQKAEQLLLAVFVSTAALCTCHGYK
ncbi:hypothetical protein JJJ22_14145 [Aeromonas caviae]|uniref:hypothetical protein n=1 Tax=Aeromonas caviae TaxID=648 RepID=UPI0019200DB4|nr:hypothetical protein [Aeromonas caviae]QQV18346.1 hypothetical protein JJJ22_14145 [Aeromonas caviae]